MPYRFSTLNFRYKAKRSVPIRYRCMIRPLTLVATFFIGVWVPQAHADENLFDGSVSLAWWSNNVSTNVLDASYDVGSIGAEVEFWWRRWGLKGSYFEADVIDNDSTQGQDFLSVDLKRRIFSPTRNSFVALGLGWENIELGTVGDGADTQGARLLLEGRLALTPIFHLYGHAAWMPSLEDTQATKDTKGREFELGLAVKPLPHISLRVGYRQFRLDFKSMDGADESSKSSGVILGAGVHW